MSFGGDDESAYAASARELTQLASELNAELKVVPSGLYNREDAQLAAQTLLNWGADLILIQCSSFSGGDMIYPFARTGIRLGIWAVSEGAVKGQELPFNSLALFNLYTSMLGRAIPEYTHPVAWYYGPVRGEFFRPRFANTVAGLRAVTGLAQARIGLIGGLVPGFDNLKTDEHELRRRLGVTVEHVPLDEVIGIARSLSDSDIVPLARAIAEEAALVDPGLEEALLTAARVERAILTVVGTGRFDGVAVACWPEFQSELGFGICSVMGRLNALGTVAACEGDLYSAVSMLALRFLSSGGVTTVMDLVDLDLQRDAVLLWHCGAGPAPLADEKGLHLTHHYTLSRVHKRAMGMMGNLTLRAGGVTLFSFADNYDRFMLLSGRIDNTTDSFEGARGWLRDMRWAGEPVSGSDLLSSIVGSHLQHHYPLVYGDLEDAVMEMAAWLNITPLPVVRYRPHTTPRRP